MCKKILLDYNYNYNKTIFTKWQHMHTKGLKIKNPPVPHLGGVFVSTIFIRWLSRQLFPLLWSTASLCSDTMAVPLTLEQDTNFLTRVIKLRDISFSAGGCVDPRHQTCHQRKQVVHHLTVFEMKGLSQQPRAEENSSFDTKSLETSFKK